VPVLLLLFEGIAIGDDQVAEGLEDGDDDGDGDDDEEEEEGWINGEWYSCVGTKLSRSTDIRDWYS
jgi:hypothetical protein